MDPFLRDELKRKLRKLKKLEQTIRFGASGARANQHGRLVWDDFFDLRERGASEAKYTLAELGVMSREAYRVALERYFAALYFTIGRATGTAAILYDPEILEGMGLPPGADEAEIKTRFRELAKRHHPDVGGDSARFIELMAQYRALLDTRGSSANARRGEETD